MNSTQLINRIKDYSKADPDAKVGVVSSFGYGAKTLVQDRNTDIVVIANTGDIDLDNEVVDPRGADVSYFMKNGVVFADHNYGLNDVAGHMRALSKYPSVSDHQAWKVRIGVIDSPMGNAVMTIVDQLGQIGVSIGFVAKDYGPPTTEERKAFRTKDGNEPGSVVRAWKWFELSFTALPCNVACQSMVMTEGKSLDMVSGVERLVTKGLVDREIASRLGVPISPKRKSFALGEPVVVARPCVNVHEWGTVIVRG